MRIHTNFLRTICANEIVVYLLVHARIIFVEKLLKCAKSCEMGGEVCLTFFGGLEVMMMRDNMKNDVKNLA